MAQRSELSSAPAVAERFRTHSKISSKASWLSKVQEKKFSRQTFRIPQHIQLYIKEDNPKYGCIFVPKFKEGIKVRLHRKLPKDGKIKQATFIKTPTNKYYAAIVFEVQDAEVQNTSTDILGIDLGIKDTITLSDGKKYKMPDLSKYERQIKRLHRRLSRKQRGSKNWEKARLCLAKLYEKIVNIKTTGFTRSHTILSAKAKLERSWWKISTSKVWFKTTDLPGTSTCSRGGDS